MNDVKRGRVLLVYPAYIGEIGKPDRPPLGLLTIAAPLVEKGVEVCLLDERADREDFDSKLVAELKKNPICVGISSMSGRHIAGALRVSKLVKENSDVPVVWGGVHPSLEPESTIRHPLVDIIVRDDGEETFQELLEALKDPNCDLSKINGIGFKDSDGKVVLTELSSPADISKIPYIPYHLVDFDRYESKDPWTIGRGLIPMETSRGCPFRCSFCTESVRKKKWRSLPPERVINDIKYYIEKYGIYNYTFIDDNLFGNIKRGEDLIDLLAKEDLGIRWYTNIRTDYMSRATPEFLQKLEKAGCCMLTFGAESGSERILKMISKHATQEHVIKTNLNLNRVNISPHYVTIRGFPTETGKDMLDTYLLLIRLVLDNKKAICDSPFLIPTPGTQIFRQCFQDASERDRDLTLEKWAEAFDLEKMGCPMWLDPKTFSVIKHYKWLVGIIQKTNRRKTGWLKNGIYRLFLRLMYKVIYLQRGFLK
ncbi:MAG TPA: radical SAM protein [Candidatus Omnitrophota bacterium]|nr:radical SAM protein [Candidatus Omnitrophota bacterium]HPS19410.1 radical SAM protein [Candidatus Omnitrophota bacterium]